MKTNRVAISPFANFLTTLTYPGYQGILNFEAIPSAEIAWLVRWSIPSGRRAIEHGQYNPTGSGRFGTCKGNR